MAREPRFILLLFRTPSEECTLPLLSVKTSCSKSVWKDDQLKSTTDKRFSFIRTLLEIRYQHSTVLLVIFASTMKMNTEKIVQKNAFYLPIHEFFSCYFSIALLIAKIENFLGKKFCALQFTRFAKKFTGGSDHMKYFLLFDLSRFVVIKYIECLHNRIFQEIIKQKATDIHTKPRLSSRSSDS